MKREVFSYVAVALFVGLVVYFLLFGFGAKKSSKKEELSEEQEIREEIKKEKESELEACEVSPKWTSESPDLLEVPNDLDISDIVELGDYSPNVLEIQSRMNKNYGSNLPLTGKLDCETHKEILSKTGLNSSLGIQVSDFKE